MTSPPTPSRISLRPFALMFLIFLEALTDGGGVDASGDLFYGDDCQHNSQCETNHCSASKRCDCQNYQHFKLVQFFDKSTRKCLSAVGKACSMTEIKGLGEGWNCVPHAVCVRNENLPSTVGLCECLQDYKENDDHLCIPFEEDPLVNQLMEETPFGDHIRNGMNMITPQRAVGHDQNDKNAQIVIEKEVIDNWQKGRLGKSQAGSRAGMDGPMVLVIACVTLFNIF